MGFTTAKRRHQLLPKTITFVADAVPPAVIEVETPQPPPTTTPPKEVSKKPTKSEV